MNPQPIIIDITRPPPNPAQDVVNVLVGSFGLVGAMAVAAMVLGVLIAGVLYWRRARSSNPLA